MQLIRKPDPTLKEFFLVQHKKNNQMMTMMTMKKETMIKKQAKTISKMMMYQIAGSQMEVVMNKPTTPIMIKKWIIESQAKEYLLESHCTMMSYSYMDKVTQLHWICSS